jgi:hypothetical protein
MKRHQVTIEIDAFEALSKLDAARQAWQTLTGADAFLPICDVVDIDEDNGDKISGAPERVDLQMFYEASGLTKEEFLNTPTQNTRR